MRIYKVSLDEGRSYPIYIGCDLFSRLPALLQEVGIQINQTCMLFSDHHVAPLYAEQVQRILCQAGYRTGLYTMVAGEQSKNIRQVEHALDHCYTFGLDRSSVILALGGGVVGDLAGFVAAIYMRGISLVQLPTTLLAHDSSVGGKVGVNHALGKNVIGTFYQPKMVCFDINVLSTLPSRHMISGYAEVIKHGFIWDEAFVRWLEQHRQALLKLHSAQVIEAIATGCEIKATIVSRDEKETGLRSILNYGHTLGHALESVSNYQYYTHGEAIAIGMAGAVQLSESIYEIPKEVVQRTLDVLKSFELPVTFPSIFSTSALLERMKKDKKAVEGSYSFVLAKKMGEVRLVKGIEKAAVDGMLRQCVVKNDTIV